MYSIKSSYCGPLCSYNYRVMKIPIYVAYIVFKKISQTINTT